MKEENYHCKICNIEVKGAIKYAIIQNDFPVFCSQECLDQFVKKEKESKQ